MIESEAAALIDDVFGRISSGGAHSVAELFEPDGIYEGAYADDFIHGNEAIATMLGDVIPRAISPFRQWPIAINLNREGTLASVEYMSEGVAVHDGSRYANLYVGIMRLSKRRIAHWREYYCPARFAAAVGPGFGELVAAHMPAGSMMPKGGHHPVKPA